MAQKSRLSVILVYKNQKEEIEPALTSLLELDNIHLELVIVDDASTDGSQEVVYSLLDHYNNDDVYYFEHEETSGRGNCLNEALQQINGPYLWVPDHFETIDGEHLEKVLLALAQSDKAGLLQRPEMIPVTIEDWVQYLDQEALPTDAVYLWNLEQIPAREQFFDPYLINHHATELAARVLNRENTGLIDPFFSVTQPDEPITPDLNLISEFVYTLLRRPSITTEQKEFLLQLLNPTLGKSVELDISKSEDDRSLKKALTYYRAGNVSAALDLLNAILAHDEDHEEAQKLKIEVLGKLRRYVEATELKHHLKKSQAAKEEQKSREEQPAQSGEPTVEPDAEEIPDEPDPLSKVTEPEGEQSEAGWAEEDDTKDMEPDHEPQTVKTPEISPDDVKTSIIIPTTADGKPVLEHCLVSIAEHVDPTKTEVIIIDNASLDDTHEYLEQLQRDNFYNCKIITHHQNPGFACSVNRGLEAANGEYACILHNDVTLQDPLLDQMEELMDDHPDYALIGPRASRALNPDQRTDSQVGGHADLLEAEYIDSFCLMLRTETGLRMDEDYGLAYFDDLDFCFRAKSKGYRVGLAPNLQVDHYYGITTGNMGLDIESPQYWQNARHFNEKWGLGSELPDNIQEAPVLKQLITLYQQVNPWYPEEHFTEYFQQLMTDEVKTQLLKQDFEKEVLVALVDLMISMNQRDVLRQLEDKLENLELPESIIYRLVAYYYSKNIFSRCNYYLEQLSEDQKTFRFRIYELKIAVTEKDMNTAIPLLTDMMEEAPFHPELYKLAGEIHQFEGNMDEVASFYKMAEQIDPYHYKMDKEKYS